MAPSARRGPCVPFNEATPFQAWRQRLWIAGATKGKGLQRSHALSGVETRRSFTVLPRSCQSFNEATPFQAWRPGTTRRCVASSRAFNEATPFQAWRPDHHEPRRGCARAFNEATPFQAWRHGVNPNIGRQERPFNEATPFQAWRQRRRSRSPTPQAAFNEATPFQAWRLWSWLTGGLSWLSLQRSHALSGVETAGHRDRGEPPEPPSTKPRPFRRGDPERERRRVHATRPSTKPRPFRRGDRSPTSSSPGPGDLQRSHALSGVETGFCCQATTLPTFLQRSHALSGVETSELAREFMDPCPPSTKPRPFRRGDGAHRESEGDGEGLQRSHALSGVETPSRTSRTTPAPSPFNEATPFQAWRQLDVMEAAFPHAPAFNEATPFQAWRLHDCGVLEGHQLVPSTKPRPFRRGDTALTWCSRWCSTTFNEATPFQAWRLLAVGVPGFFLGLLQRSHALSGVETPAGR